MSLVHNYYLVISNLGQCFRSAAITLYFESIASIYIHQTSQVSIVSLILGMSILMCQHLVRRT